MRHLTHSGTLKRAGVAALITVMACYPRLATWMESQWSLPFLTVTLLFCVFVLWAFVFAWHYEYTKQPVFNFEFEPKLWVLATLYAVASAMFMYFVVDEQLRRTTPGEYPASLSSWPAWALFHLGLEPLFLCFAPFAFFMRLSKRQTTALAMVVLFFVFVFYLRLDLYRVLPPFTLIMELMVLQVIRAFVSVYFYLKGGALLVWWVWFVPLARLLIDFL